MAEFSVHADASASDHECQLVVAGDVDIDTADQMAQAGLLAIAQHPTRALVVDLREVTFMDSTGLKAMVTLRDGATRAGTHIRLRNVPTQVRKILAITALDGLLAPDEAATPTPTGSAPETIDDNPETLPQG